MSLYRGISTIVTEFSLLVREPRTNSKVPIRGTFAFWHVQIRIEFIVIRVAERFKCPLTRTMDEDFTLTNENM